MQQSQEVEWILLQLADIMSIRLISRIKSIGAAQSIVCKLRAPIAIDKPNRYSRKHPFYNKNHATSLNNGPEREGRKGIASRERIVGDPAIMSSCPDAWPDLMRSSELSFSRKPSPFLCCTLRKPHLLDDCNCGPRPTTILSRVRVVGSYCRI